MYRPRATSLSLGLIAAIASCTAGDDADSQGETQTASAASTEGSSAASTQGSATSGGTDTTGASSMTDTATSAGTTSAGESTDSMGSTSAGESTTTATTATTATTDASSTGVSDSDATTEASTTEGTTGVDTQGTTTEGTTTQGTTEGTTTEGGSTTEDTDVPDFVAECADDPANPVIVTVAPNVTARFPTITSGLAAASDGSVIEVCPGSYNDKIEVTIDITLRGAGADKTIIDGGGFHFNLGAGEAVVEGFGFTHSNAKVPNGWNIGSSGAITMNDTYGVQETLTIRACRFFENSAEYGAALHVSGSNNGGKNPDIYIEDSVFEDNVATAEGGAIASYGRVHITDSIFVANKARTGGALALSYGCTGPSVCDVANTVIKKNHSTGSNKYEGGGGIFIDSCGLNCLGGLTVTDSDLGFGASEENTNYQDLPEDVLINDGADPWNRYGWYYNNVSFACANGSCAMP